jgi:allantoicase
MKRVLFLAAAALSLTVLAANAADSTKVNGYISESMCGAKHMSGNAADKACVTKCVQGGSSPVLVDSKKQIWAIDNPDSVKDYYGDHVMVNATIDSSKKSVHIDSIAEAK